MAEAVLCLVVFVMLCWVLLLESRTKHLQGENKALRETVRRQAEVMKSGVAVSGGQKVKVERSIPITPAPAKTGGRGNMPRVGAQRRV